MDRTEHMAWSKERAMEYAEQGDVSGTLSSLASDLRKHEDTADHGGLMLGTMLAMAGHLQTPAQLRDWVKGFN